jgi:amino acid adenylation domain-containing protein
VTSLLHRPVEDAAQRAPEQPAVVDGERVVTYGELDGHSGRIANVLRALGVAPGERVCLYVDKSYEALAAIYGVLKAGSAYVPLDPRAPVARLAGIVADAQPRVLLTTADRKAGWNALAEHVDRVVVLDSGSSNLAEEAELTTERVELIGRDVIDSAPTAVAGPRPDLDDLAYILYTSGSTGVPKGVMLSHRNGASFVEWAVAAVGATSADRFSSHAPLHFDLSVFDVFGASLAGAPVVLVPKAASVFPVELAKFIDRAHISVWYSVPSILTMLAERGGLEPGALPTLRTVVFAGEVFPTPHLHRMMTLVPHATFWNWYGPTETNVCTGYRVDARPACDGPDIPIGAAIAGVDTVALADDNSVQPPGEVGELLVAGPTVMRGYWGDPERTAERLVVDPMGAGDGRTWYRTGDLVTQLPDGNYRFLGRRDNQVKSRGYRIELGDIETALHAHPSVHECAAVAVPDAMVTNRIQAWIVATGAVTAGDLAAFCNQRLPNYMVPEKFRFVDALPRTSTDKIDRRQLADRAAAD